MTNMAPTRNGKQSRGWCYTFNNYTDATITVLSALAPTVTYLIYGKEKCPTTGTPHLQGYLYYKNKRRFKSVKKELPDGCHIESAQGNPQQNHDYCIKEGDFTEYGVLPKAGKRVDLDDFGSMVRESDNAPTETDLLINHAAIVARYPLFVDRVINHFHAPVQLETTDNLWLYGVSGGGKSYHARTLGEYYSKDVTNQWFCGYNNEPNIIIEEVQPCHGVALAHLLKKLADVYVVQVQVKNGSKKIRPKRIIITSNYSIEQMNWDIITTRAIKRRFSSMHFSTVHSECPEGGGLVLPPT